MRAITDETGRSIFPYRKPSSSVDVVVAPKLGKQLTEELAQKAMDVCPVGSILVKEKGFNVPIGERKYDKTPIGSDVENMQITKI
jgi:[NiFe] hydrogenase diaphorase moiety small subunit